MNKIIEKIIYAFWINWSFYDIDKELNYLKNNITNNFLYRDVIDIGCWDGKISLKLIQVLKPKSFKWIDASKSLVKNAQKNWIQATVLDVEKKIFEWWFVNNVVSFTSF